MTQSSSAWWQASIDRAVIPPASTSSPIELTAKRMQLLRELVPAAKRLALLNNPTDAVNESLLRDVKAAAIGQQILVFEAATGREIDAAFENLVRERKLTRCLSLEELSSAH